MTRLDASAQGDRSDPRSHRGVPGPRHGRGLAVIGRGLAVVAVAIVGLAGAVASPLAPAPTAQADTLKPGDTYRVGKGPDGKTYYDWWSYPSGSEPDNYADGAVLGQDGSGGVNPCEIPLVADIQVKTYGSPNGGSQATPTPQKTSAPKDTSAPQKTSTPKKTAPRATTSGAPRQATDGQASGSTGGAGSNTGSDTTGGRTSSQSQGGSTANDSTANGTGGAGAAVGAQADPTTASSAPASTGASDDSSASADPSEKAASASSAATAGTISVDGTPAAGATVTVTGAGFAPGAEDIAIEVHSDPIVVGTANADDSGKFSAEVTIPDSLPAGAHQIVARVGDSEVAAPATFTVAAVQGEAQQRTRSLGGLAILGGLVVAAVAAVIVTATVRRRRKPADAASAA